MFLFISGQFLLLKVPLPRYSNSSFHYCPCLTALQWAIYGESDSSCWKRCLYHVSWGKPTQFSQVVNCKPSLDLTFSYRIKTNINKAVYTPPQSRTGGQERFSKKYTDVLFGRGRNAEIARKSKMWRTNRPTDRPTDTASSRVACPWLKIDALRK